MDTSNFFYTWPGMYATQSFLHALVATIVTGAAIEIWHVDSPAVRQRFRLATILVAIFSFPLYQLADPARGSVFSRPAALFDSLRWLDMELWHAIPLRLFLLLLFASTSFVFIFQELLPILRHLIEPTVDPAVTMVKPSPESPIGRALRSMPGAVPDVYVIPDDEPVLFSTTRRSPAIYLSAGLASLLTAEQVRAAVAHEMAHIARGKRSVLIAGFVLRTFMFFNPVVLVEFRRAIRNEEKICDDVAVAMTGEPQALADTLKKVYAFEGPQEGTPEGTAPRRKMRLEDYSHNLQIETRIARLEEGTPPGPGGAWCPFALCFSLIIAINYFIM